MLTWLASKLTGYAVAIAAVLAILAGVYRKGGTDASARQTSDRLNELNKARKVEHEVDRRSGDDARRDLERWMRDK
jgi:hypothetical protein